MSTTKKDRRQVNGLLLLDKPIGITSNAALQQVKRLYNAAKAGHTGSLDPIASGMLPICFGEATKFSQFLLDADKSNDFILRILQTITIIAYHHSNIPNFEEMPNMDEINSAVNFLNQNALPFSDFLNQKLKQNFRSFSIDFNSLSF